MRMVGGLILIGTTASRISVHQRKSAVKLFLGFLSVLCVHCGEQILLCQLLFANCCFQISLLTTRLIDRLRNHERYQDMLKLFRRSNVFDVKAIR